MIDLLTLAFAGASVFAFIHYRLYILTAIPLYAVFALGATDLGVALALIVLIEMTLAAHMGN